MGLGWLGLALAHSLKSSNIKVSGTVTSSQKQDLLLTQEIQADLFNLYLDSPKLTNNQFDNLAIYNQISATTLVLNIPPGRQNFQPVRFVDAMITLIDSLMLKGLKKLIFISTTSVFCEEQSVVTNASVPVPATESGKAHFKIEQHLFKHYANASAVLRLSGLVGPNPDGSLRHPIFVLSKKQNIAKGKDVVNLVHQADVIAAITQLINNNAHPHSLNLAAADHPTRSDYYSWCAQQLGLPQPGFAPDNKKRQQAKLIDASQTFSCLGIEPIYKSPYDMLN